MRPLGCSCVLVECLIYTCPSQVSFFAAVDLKTSSQAWKELASPLGGLECRYEQVVSHSKRVPVRGACA
jgi:hypothetical protein